MAIFTTIAVLVVGWLVSRSLQPDAPKDPGAELNKQGTDQFIPKIVGTVKRAKPIIVFKKTNDVDNDSIPNDLLHIILVWGHSVESIDNFYIDDININEKNDLFYNDDGRWAYAVHFPNGVKTYDAQTDSMVPYFDGPLRAAGWGETDLWEGKACTYVRLEYAGGENTLRNEPQFTADITGTNTKNPATHLLDYLKSAEYGKSLSDRRLDLSAFSAAATICDMQVEEVVDSGVFRSLFTSNVVIDTSNPVIDNTNMFLRSMRAMMPVLNGKLTPIVEKDDPPVSLSINQDDIVSIDNVRNSNKSNRFNRVLVTYYEDDANGTKQEAIYPIAGSQVETDWLEEDKDSQGQYVMLEKSIELETCRNYYEALAFAKSFAEVSREQLRCEIELDLWATLYEVGDIVNVNHDYFGWLNKPFRIESTDEDDFKVKLNLREHQPYIYDFENTGLKPSIPDTSNKREPLVSPTSLTKIDKYNKNSLVQIQWDSPFPRFQVIVISGTEVIQRETVSRKYYDITNVPQGTYTFRVRALNDFNSSSIYASLDVVIDQDPANFTWKIYADDANGLNASLTDTSKAFFGLSFNRDTVQSGIGDLTLYTYFANGGSGADGKSVFQASVFKRSTTLLDTAPTGGSFNFGTNVLTPPAGWSITRPEGAGDLYSSGALFSVDGDTGIDSTTTWSTPAKDLGEGKDGVSVYTYNLYRRAASKPAIPTGGSYNFTNQTIVAPTGWTIEPAEGSNPLYVVVATAQVTGPTGTDSQPSYSDTRLLVKDGDKGDSGNSAYELWLLDGNTGSLQDFLDDLNGKDGVPGNKWLNLASIPNANEGDIDDFALSAGRYVYRKVAGNPDRWVFQYDLKGEKGDKGDKGTDGARLFIIYNSANNQPGIPTGDGTADGWSDTRTATTRWQSQKIAINRSVDSWSTPVPATNNDSQISVNAGSFLSGGGSFTTDQADNATIDLNVDETALSQSFWSKAALVPPALSVNYANSAGNADTVGGVSAGYLDHRAYTRTDNYLGGYYTSGGSEKPNDPVFGKGKLKLAMLSGTNLGAGPSWNDVLWLSSYSGSDVKQSNAIAVGKGGTGLMYLFQQNYDSATWGTPLKIWNQGNDGAGSGLDADLLDGLQSTTSATANTVAVRDASAYVDINGLRFASGPSFMRKATSRPSLIEVNSGSADWAGINVKSNASRSWSFMATISGGADYCGIYNEAVSGFGAHWVLRSRSQQETELYYGPSKKFSTTSTGVDVTGSVNASGNIVATGGTINGTLRANVFQGLITATSALKYKEIDYREDTQVSLNKVVEIGSKGVAVGTFKDNRDEYTHRWFIADEVNEVMPEVVIKENGEIEALNYQEMLTDAYAAIAQLKKELDELKAVVNG